jgi:hypothetical protein
MTNRVTTDEIHELTRAEIARQIKRHSERRQQIVAERAELFETGQINGATSDALLSSDERAAREHARRLLNGASPAFLEPQPDVGQDRALARELAGIEIVLRVLSDKDLAARAAEAVAWSEQHATAWSALVREILLTIVRLNALEKAAAELLAKCPDIFAVNLPLANLIGGQPILETTKLIGGRWPMMETTIGDLPKVGIKAGIISAGDVRKAEKNGP